VDCLTRSRSKRQGAERKSGNPQLAAFAKGLQRHGIEPVRKLYSDRPEPCNVAVAWAFRNRRLVDQQRLTGGRFLTTELGYVGDREAWTSLGWDGLNGKADFGFGGPWHQSERSADPKRWQTLFPDLVKPWRVNKDGYVLLIGQVEGDAALHGADIRRWYVATARAAQRAYRRPVMFRPHPKGSLRQMPLVPNARGSSLEQALEGAMVVVTFSSNAGVLAALAGVPVVTLDPGAMAWPVAGHELGELVTPDREEWCARLAWCQWSLDELANGEAWAHIGKFANGSV